MNAERGHHRPPRPPQTRQVNVVDVIHGVEIPDPYRWLEDGASPETRAWIDAQNEYTRTLMDGLPSLEPTRKRLAELASVDYTGAPVARDGVYFFVRRLAGEEQMSICRRRGANGPDEVLIDPRTIGADIAVALVSVSKDGRLLAYGVRRGGEDEDEIRILDVEAGSDLPDRLPRALHFNAFSFRRDGAGFFYSVRSTAGMRVCYHPIGTPVAEDKVVFGEGLPPTAGVGPLVSHDGRYVSYAVAHGWRRGELYLQDVDLNRPARPIVAGIDARFTHKVFVGDRVLIQTNWNASNMRIVAIDLEQPEPNHWQDLVPEVKAAIQDFSLVGNKVLVHYIENVSSKIKAFDLKGRPVGELALPTLGTALSSPQGEPDSDEAFFSFSSFAVPNTTYRVDMGSLALNVWSCMPLSIDAATIECRQEWYESKDGTRIPMFLVQKQGLAKDAGTPTILYGYGGFNVSLMPTFNPGALAWVEQGGLFVSANIRGGGEFGEAWHRAGMLEQKQNVFDDFIAAAEYLFKEGYTCPGKLALQGASNGGLLVGAVITQRPDICQAVICDFPDLDLVRYPEFVLNPPVLLEYGDARDPEQFRYIIAYSPYQSVNDGAQYPAVLFTTGDADTRVPPLQARKMTARMQAATRSGRPILLQYETEAGHSAGVRLTSLVERVARELAFLHWQLGAPDQGERRE